MTLQRFLNRAWLFFVVALILCALAIVARSKSKVAVKVFRGEGKEVQIAPYRASHFYGTIESGAVPQRGDLICEEKAEDRPDDDGVVRRHPPILYCTDGVRIRIHTIRILVGE